MKKIFALLLVLALALSMIACGKKEEPSTEPASTETEKATEKETEKETETEEPSTEEPVKVMTHEEFMAAAVDEEVIVETYVQAKQSWWEDKATVYTQAPDGAYFLYQMACSEEEYAKLTTGTKIRVKGIKAEWAGEVEITEATFEILGGDVYQPTPFYAADYLTDPDKFDSLIEHQNEAAYFSRMVVSAKNDEGAGFLYGWDGSGERGDDLYFDVTPENGGNVITMTVESYLCGEDTDVYKAVEALKPGDVIDIRAYLYWYEGANPHVTEVSAPGTVNAKEFAEAAVDTRVSVDTFIQAKQSWWDGKGTFYTQAGPLLTDGAYFLYEMECSEEEYNKLEIGTPVRVTGYVAEWSGEREIIEATYEILDREPQVFDAGDVTNAFGTHALNENLQKVMNYFVSMKGVTVEASDDAGSAFLYKWDGSGQQGDDLYFKVSKDGETLQMTVESYLCGQDTDVYKAVEGLKVGDVIDLECFMYWYLGPNPHVTKVTVK